MSDLHDPLWYKDAIIYQTHIKAYFDANNDGIGDFAGLIEKLDYIKDLGVTAIWLLPFYPSPLRDDGYDIQDYRSINSSYGTMADVRRLVREAHKRDLKVITELVINHTSDQHPWFQKSRAAKPGSKWRNFYVWSDSDQIYTGTRIIFLDTEPSNWTWDPVAKAYYWHRFYSHQPDLNFDNPEVVKEVLRLMHFWLAMGIDGLRLDAIPYLIEREGTNCENLPETHDVLKVIRKEMDEHFPGRFLLAEANQWPEDTRPYFGEGDECHMAFHFPLMPRMYLAVAREDRYPITDIMRQTPEIPENCQWAIFLRNHDELTLEMVTENERDYLWNTYAADRRMRINLGIRRRLAPLMENDRRKIELMNSLLFSMPGTPVVYYGDEIGMGDNVFLGDRDGVRTPMQWSLDRNGGFSRANPQALYLPSIMDPVYGYQAVNVEAQTRNPSSLLNWMRRLIAVRRTHKAFSRGSLSFLYPGNRKILAYVRECGGEVILCAVNLSRFAQPVELDLSIYKGRIPVELLSRNSFPPIGDLPYLLTLPGHAFYWFQLAEEATVPSWHADVPDIMPELQTIVLGRAMPSILEGRNRTDLERQILPAFAVTQRWFAAKDAKIDTIGIDAYVQLDGPSGPCLLTILSIALADARTQRYLLPLGIAWGDEQIAAGAPLLPFTLAKARKGPRVGALHDAAVSPDLAPVLLDGMRRDLVLEAHPGRLHFIAGSGLDRIELEPDALVRRLGVEQSNSSILMGRQLIMKLYRRLESGIHPEVEIAQFLTEEAGFANTPPLLGSIMWQGEDGGMTAIAGAYGFVQNQGDGWQFTLDYLSRETEHVLPELVANGSGEQHGDEPAHFHLYSAYARTLGIRTAELHKAFAVETDNPAFKAEPIDGGDLVRWSKNALAQSDAAFAAIERARPDLDVRTAKLADRARGLKTRLEAWLKGVPDLRINAIKTRVHGDYHLGQVVVAGDDFFILDFEGEPSRSLEERRAKTSALKDVAGMVRSFDYAAWSLAERVLANHPAYGDRLEAMLEDWRKETVGAFLRSYRETIGKTRSLPMDAHARETLLQLFLIEKVSYEICYEAANRPTWVHIPLAGLIGCLARDPSTGKGLFDAES